MKTLILLTVLLPATALAQSGVQLQFTNTLPATIAIPTATDTIYVAPGAVLDLSKTYSNYNVDSLYRSLSTWYNAGVLTSPSMDPLGDLYKLTPVTYGNFGLPYPDGGTAFLTDTSGNLTLGGNLVVNNHVAGPSITSYGLGLCSEPGCSLSGFNLGNNDGQPTGNPFALIQIQPYNTTFEVGEAGGGGIFSAGLINYNTTSVGPDGGFYLTNSCVFGQWETVSGSLLSCMNADGSETLAQGAWTVDASGNTIQSGSMRALSIIEPPQPAIPTCNAGNEGLQITTKGVATGQATKVCYCGSNGSSTYAWCSLKITGAASMLCAGGSSTVCP